jgi:Tfp pilus assembly protein PilF
MAASAAAPAPHILPAAPAGAQRGWLAKAWLQGLALAGAALLPYLSSLRDGFVYDDTSQVLLNPYILNFHHLKAIFTTTVWSFQGGSEGATNYYRPLMTFSYLICHALFGYRAWAYHGANLVLNALVVMALWQVSRILLKNDAAAFLSALIFALHPVHCEVVDWIAALTELQITLFFLLTFWAYTRAWRDDGRLKPGAWLGMMAGFALCLLSKEQALVFPVLAMAYEHLYRLGSTPSASPRRALRYLPLWAMSAAYFIFRVKFMGAFAPVLARPHLSLDTVAMAALGLGAQYVTKLLWPAHLQAIYPFPHNLAILTSWAALGLVIAAGAAVLFVWLWKRYRILSFGIIWFAVTLAPVLNIRWMSVSVFAERYLYLPSVGACWIAAWTMTEAWNRAAHRPKIWRTVGAAAACLLMLLAVTRIVTRNSAWKDDFAFCTTALAQAPDSAQMHNNLGRLYWDQGNIQQAKQQWETAHRLTPSEPETRLNLGLVAMAEGHMTQARGYFAQVITDSPNFALARIDLADLDRKEGRLHEAELGYRWAIELAPFDLRARLHYGEMLMDQRRFAEARQQLQAAVESHPYLQAYLDLGLCDWALGNLTNAEAVFARAEKLNPQDIRPHLMLGLFYAQTHREVQALQEYRISLRLDPTNQQARKAVNRLSGQDAGQKP